MTEEDTLQYECVKWFTRTYPGVLIFAIPNGGKRGIQVAMTLQVTGVKRGIPDLCIPAAFLYIEMKTARGRISPEQKWTMEYLTGCGYHCKVARSLADFQSICDHHVKGRS